MNRLENFISWVILTFVACYINLAETYRFTFPSWAQLVSPEQKNEEVVMEDFPRNDQESGNKSNFGDLNFLMLSLERRSNELTAKAISENEKLNKIVSEMLIRQKEYADEAKTGIGPKAKKIMVEVIRPLEEKVGASRATTMSINDSARSIKELTEKIIDSCEVIEDSTLVEVSYLDISQRIFEIEEPFIEVQIDSLVHDFIPPETRLIEGIDSIKVLPSTVVETINSVHESKMERNRILQASIDSENTEGRLEKAYLRGKLYILPRPKAGEEYHSQTMIPLKDLPRSLLGTKEMFGGVKLKLPQGKTIKYEEVKGTAFSHKGQLTDPGDGGWSYYGFRTGLHQNRNQVIQGAEGVSLPPQVYEGVAPAAQLDVRVRNKSNNRELVAPIVDIGPSRTIWKEVGRPVIDLTPRVAEFLGGILLLDSCFSEIRGVRGLDNLEIEITIREEG